MGTTCCTGRNQEFVAPETLPVRKTLPRRKNPSRTVRTKAKLDISLGAPAPDEPIVPVLNSSRLKLSNVSEDLGAGQVITLLNFESEEEGGEEVHKVSPVMSPLSYSLDRLEDLPALHFSSLNSSFQSLRDKSILYSEEKLLGVANCQGQEGFFDDRNLLLLLSSCRLLWFDALKARTVLHHMEITDLRVVLFSVNKDSVGLFIPPPGESVWFKSNKTMEIVKALEVSYHPLKGTFLPYAVFDHPLDLQNALTDFPQDLLLTLYSYDRIQLLEVIVNHGNIGEKVLNCRESTLFSVSAKIECIFVMTDEAIYSLYRDFGLQSRVGLMAVQAILVSLREEAIGVHTTSERLYWKLPISTSESLSNLIRSRTGRKLQTIYSKTIEMASPLNY